MDFQTSNENQSPMGDLSALEKIKILSKQAQGYLAGAADSALLGAPSFIARKTGNEKAWNDFTAQNPYPESAEWSGNIASTLLPVGVPSKLAAGTMKATGKLIPRAAEKLGRLAEQTLQNSRYLQSLTGAKGMALRGATNAAWQSAPREAMKENPEWGSVPLEAAMGAVTGPVVGKVSNKIKSITTDEIMKLQDEGIRNLFIRWSRGPKFDKTPSRDYVSGKMHEGVSAVPIDFWEKPIMNRRLKEYEFLRIKDPKIAPYIYKGTPVGVDSDGYALLPIGSEVIGKWVRE